MIRKVVLDIETTGLDYNIGDKIIEIGCVELINNIPSTRTFHSYINPKKNISLSAYKVHGISNEYLSDKPKFKEIANSFIDFLQDSQLIVHNAKFDIGFINNELFLLGKSKISYIDVIDTLPLARKRFPGLSVSLDSLCRKFNISLNNRIKHGALVDAKLLSQVYFKLIQGKQSSFSFYKSKENTNMQFTNFHFKYRIFQNSLKEEKEHKNMLKKIPNNLWNK